MKILPGLSYLSMLAVVTIITGLIYVTVQQNYRMSADDPQIQMARDMAVRLEEGKSVQPDILLDTVDLQKSIAPFVVLYNANKQPVRSSAYLNGRLPQLPDGVFDHAISAGENRITWQPQKDVRMAMIVKKVSSPEVAYVAVGRSLKEVESRESNLEKMVAVCWLLCCLIILLNWGLQIYKRKNLSA